MKKLLLVLAIAVAVVVAAFVMRDAIIKGVIESSVGKVTGLRLTIGSFRTDPGKSVIDIRDLKLANPPAFGRTYMIDAPEVYIVYDLPEIMKGRVHLRQMRLQLNEFVLMRSASGATNIDTIKSRLAAQPGKPKEASSSNLLIDELSLKIGKVAYKDLVIPSASKDLNLNINEKFFNITDLRQVVAIIMTRAVINSGVARLAKMDVSDLQGVANAAMQGALDKALAGSGLSSSGSAKQASDAIKGAMDIFGAIDKKSSK